MKLYMTTIVILSDFDPGDMDTETLTRDAIYGDSYLYSRKQQETNIVLFGEDVAGFFSADDANSIVV